MPIIGTSPDMIDAAEDRERFHQLLHTLGLRQPPNATARTESEAWKSRRPGLSAGGASPAMCWAGGRWRSCTNSATWSATCARAVKVSNDSPVLLDRFLNDAIECDVDCIRDATGATLLAG